MNIHRNQQRRQAGSRDNLTKTDREYMAAWENADPEFLEAASKLGIGPDLGRQGQGGPINHEHDDRDVFATIAAPQSEREYDEPEQLCVDSHSAAEAVLRVLYVLCGSNNPSLRLRADCLLAIINRTDSRSQAEIARKYNLTRAAISKIMRDMRNGEHLAGLEIFFFGGRKCVSEQSRARALRVHNEIKTQNQSWKPSSKLTKLLTEL